MADINKIADLMSEEIFNRLPEEAVDKVIALGEQEGNHDAEILQIFTDYGVDINAIAKAKIEENQNA